MSNIEQTVMTFPAKPEYVGVVRLVVSGIANRMGYTYDEIEDIKIAVSEACGNAVQHAYEDQEGEVKLTCGVHEDRLEMTIEDSGKTFADDVKRQAAPVEETAEIESLHEGGLGLFLIEALMDDVSINKDNGVKVTMTKLLNRDEVDQSASKISTTPSQ
ncbi:MULTISPECIES: anti-sigma B factor RsbW [Exiguobacterium]|uniref:Serine-protein kinase RsbW n=1 Tax=Exiguobacterium aurantiacum TaxID=33987 RepID=A0ABY5FN04_9BACL|nr:MULTISPECIES: anti-sigma B factor RsbW [Exiguobacterium]MCT4778402.1 anti-sigma B factor RsbW [Exiguobacterium aquaticum]MCT4790032.1 anti-sigma B factor RsbW [Exiguobacterium mexicanum]RHB50171.1 anti-sigma B factor RsbW [Exiguobacterium sp. AM39-5BH]UTT42617.1 anti-sigma B factor RsbW [Exiguobacterium aurantiacum]